MTGTDAHLFSALGDRAQWWAVNEDAGRSTLAETRPEGNHRVGLPVAQREGDFPSEEGARAMTEKDNPEAVRPQPGAGENICRKCQGSGKVDGETCPECGGSGKVTTPIGGG